MNKVYEIVQKKILERLEKAIENNESFAWVKPWRGGCVPTNFKTKKPYRGINLLLLEQGGYYMTFDQVVKMKGSVKKGATAHMVVYWNFKEVEASSLTKEEKEESDVVSETSNKNSKKKTRVIFKYYKVFHQSDIEGIDFPEESFETEGESNLKADKIIGDYSSYVVPITEVPDFDSAFYSWKLDLINVPDRAQFKNISEFYSVVFHEMVHSTGHESRLNRDIENSFGSSDYSKEELVAEIGSSLLRAYCGIEDQNADNNSIAYLKGWYSRIKNANPTEITYSAQNAQKAVQYVLDSAPSAILEAEVI